MKSILSLPDPAERIHAAGEMLNLSPTVTARAALNIVSGKVELIAASGKLTAGKDTICEQYLAALGAKNPLRVALADGLKDEVTRAIEVIVDVRDASRRRHLPSPIRVLARHAVNEIVEELDCTLEGAVDLVNILWHAPNLRGVNGWTRTAEVRLALQYWGTNERRERSHDLYWIFLSWEKLLTAAAEGRHIYVPDVRFPNEVEALQAIGFPVVRLDISPETQQRRLSDRDGLLPDPAALVARSEVALDDYDGFDLRVDNDGSMAETLNLMLEVIGGCELVDAVPA